MKSLISLTALISAGAVAMAGATWAETGNSEELTLFSEAQIDIQRALTVALESANGKIASIEFENEAGKSVYEVVAVAPDGAMTEILIDANDGTVIGQSPYTDDDDEEDDGND